MRAPNTRGAARRAASQAGSHGTPCCGWLQSASTVQQGPGATGAHRRRSRRPRARARGPS
eukprot:5144211-Alexandrium_andersonii.AAC.1